MATERRQLIITTHHFSLRRSAAADLLIMPKTFRIRLSAGSSRLTSVGRKGEERRRGWWGRGSGQIDSMLWKIDGAGLPRRVLKLFSWPLRSRRGRSPYRTSLAVTICLRPSAFVSPWLGSSQHLRAGGDEDARLSCSVNEAAEI